MQCEHGNTRDKDEGKTAWGWPLVASWHDASGVRRSRTRAGGTLLYAGRPVTAVTMGR